MNKCVVDRTEEAEFLTQIDTQEERKTTIRLTKSPRKRRQRNNRRTQSVQQPSDSSHTTQVPTSNATISTYVGVPSSSQEVLASPHPLWLPRRARCIHRSKNRDHRRLRHKRNPSAVLVDYFKSTADGTN